MRIEEVASGEYIKIPNNLEQKMIKTMNRFFETDADAVAGSREDIILEIEKRLRPLIGNMVKRVAWLEGKVIFEQQLEAVLEEELDGIIQDLHDKLEELRTDLLKYIPLKFSIATPTTVVSLPAGIVLKPGVDIVQVFVNGMLQELSDNYQYVLSSVGNINGIDFAPGTLDKDDVVKLECFAYSEQPIA